MGHSIVLLIFILLNVRNFYCNRDTNDYNSKLSIENNSYEDYEDSNEVYIFEELNPLMLRGKNYTLASTNKTDDQSKDNQDPSRRSVNIFNKTDDNVQNQYAYVITIQRKGSHYATGALVNNRWILSVAGEFYNVRESIKLFKVRLGSPYCKKGGRVESLKMIQFHPLYVYGQPNFDLAMLRLASVIEYTPSIKPITISTVNSKVISAKFLSTYWPRLIVKGKLLPQSAKERAKPSSLRISTQKLIPHHNCDSIVLSMNVTLNSSTLCLKPFVVYHSDCMPDAGAPVIGEDGLWGITSGWTSQDCLSNPSPVVFTRLSSPPVQSWLNELLLSRV